MSKEPEEVELTFRKDFGCVGGAGLNRADLYPYTVDGKLVKNVIYCCVEAGVDQLPVMTIKVTVMETLAQHAAVRLMK